MKAVQFKISKPSKESIKLQEDRQNHFYDSLHFHPEIQITLILKGSGTYIISGKKGEFSEGDLFIIGKNDPHVFRSDIKYYENNQLESHSVSVFFNRDSFGENFFDTEELYILGKLINNFCKGVKIETSSDKIKNTFLSLFNLNPLKKFQKFIFLLDLIEQSFKTFINPEAELIKTGKNDENKLPAVYNYIIENFKDDVSLKKAAEISNLSIPSFCRYIKKRTRKTFTQLVNDLRISEAQKLLIKNELSISEIAFEVGYKNLSHFNRKFKSTTGKTPGTYSLNR